MARLGPAAVLELARLPGFRRRPGHRPVHPLDRRGAHVHRAPTFPISAVAAGGVYNYKDGRTAPDTINVLLEYPAEVHGHLRSHAGPGHRGEGIEFCGTEGSLLHRPRPLRIPRRWAATPRSPREGHHQPGPGSHPEFPGVHEIAQPAQRRRAHRPPLRAGLAPGQHRLRCRNAASTSTRCAKRFCRSRACHRGQRMRRVASSARRGAALRTRPALYCGFTLKQLEELHDFSNTVAPGNGDQVQQRSVFGFQHDPPHAGQPTRIRPGQNAQPAQRRR